MPVHLCIVHIHFDWKWAAPSLYHLDFKISHKNSTRVKNTVHIMWFTHIISDIVCQIWNLFVTNIVRTRLFNVKNILLWKCTYFSSSKYHISVGMTQYELIISRACLWKNLVFLLGQIFFFTCVLMFPLFMLIDVSLPTPK